MPERDRNSKSFLEKMLDKTDDPLVGTIAGIGVATFAGIGAVAIGSNAHPPVIIEISQNNHRSEAQDLPSPWPKAQNPGQLQTWGAKELPAPVVTGHVALYAYPPSLVRSSNPKPTATPTRLDRSSADDWYKDARPKKPNNNGLIPVPAELTPALKRLDPDLRAGIFAEAKNTLIPVSLTIAQAINETGGSNACNNNYFGVKGPADSRVSGLCYTWESINGQVVHMNAWFRKFETPQDAVAFNHSLIESYKPIKELLARGEKDPRQFAYALQRSGYATDPAYPQKLIKLMETYDLFQYDVHND